LILCINIWHISLSVFFQILSGGVPGLPSYFLLQQLMIYMQDQMRREHEKEWIWKDEVMTYGS
jgi:hypothetical protein